MMIFQHSSDKYVYQKNSGDMDQSIPKEKSISEWTGAPPKRMYVSGTFLEVQWLRLLASNTGGTGWIPDWGARKPHALWPKKQNL